MTLRMSARELSWDKISIFNSVGSELRLVLAGVGSGFVMGLESLLGVVAG